MRKCLKTTKDVNRKGYGEIMEICAKIARKNHLMKLSFDIDMEVEDVKTRPAELVTRGIMKDRIEAYIDRALDMENLDAAIEFEKILLAC